MGRYKTLKWGTTRLSPEPIVGFEWLGKPDRNFWVKVNHDKEQHTWYFQLAFNYWYFSAYTVTLRELAEEIYYTRKYRREES